MPRPPRNKVTFAHPPHQTIAGCFALSSFAIAIVTGLYAENPTDVILGRAMVCLFLCYFLGVVLGRLCTHAVAEYLRERIGSMEIPDSDVSIEEIVQEIARKQQGAAEPALAQAEEPEQVSQE